MIKKALGNRVIYNTIVLSIYTFLIEFLVRIFTGVELFSAATFRIFLSSVIIALFLSFLGHFFNKITHRVLNIVYVVILGVFEFVEVGLFNYLGFFMGIGNSDQGTKVVDYIKDYLSSMPGEYWLILIFTVLMVIYFVTLDRLILKNKKRNKKLNMTQKVYIEIVTVIVLLLLHGVYFLTVKSEKMQSELQTEKNYYIWLFPENSNLAVSNFGVAVYFYRDLNSQIKHIDADYIMELELKEEEKNKKNEEKTTKKTTTKAQDPEVPQKDYTRTINDEAWKLLDKNTTDATQKTLNSYFMGRKVTQKNDMTGIFEGKNLIIILMESVNEISIMNEEYFPTMAKLYNEGISFRNNFSPRNNCSTGNNELTVLTSLFTINNTCTANTYSNNSYPEASFSIFKNKGYIANGFHDYTLKYYYRNRYIPKMGADKFYSVKDLGIPYDDKYEEWPDDADMFKQAKKYFMAKKPFMAYFASVSTHQTYNVPSTLGDKYRAKYEKLGYSKTLSRYLSKMQVWDEALAVLLKELEDAGELDNTVIALFGDHFPYGLTDKQVNEFLTKNNAGYTINRNSTTEKNVDRTPLIIYNSASKPLIVNDYTTIIDLLPTLLNMFNMDYDPRLYLGTDIFSEDHVSRAVFADGSWMNENGFYYAPNSKLTLVENASKKYTNEELKTINSEISKRQKMSASAIKSNYFKYLGDGLKKYQEQINKDNNSENTDN